MRLSEIQVRDFRSYFAHDRGAVPFTLAIPSGMTSIIGPNNCGKSNLLRALALAMSDDVAFDPNKDRPPGHEGGPRFRLSFDVPSPGTVEERQLLKLARDYERSVQGGAQAGTYADEGQIRLAVRFTYSERDGWRRDESVVVKGVGARRGDAEQQARLLGLLHRKIAFVAIPSGESLTTVVSGHLRRSLRGALDKSQRTGLARAAEHRAKLEAVLRDEVFGSLQVTVAAFVKAVFPDIENVELGQIVPSLDELVGQIEFRITDAVASELERKGTGVRSGLIVALLRHLAGMRGQSLVVGLEEPESFIHPAAQDRLRDGLEEIATNPDLTLLVTTHSPHIITRQSEGALFALQKTTSGATVIKTESRGDEVGFSEIADLYSGGEIPDLLRDVGTYPPGTRCVLMVEGTTDRDYLYMAADALGRTDSLAGVLVSPAGGATKAVSLLLVHRAAIGAPQVLALFDTDEPGRSARQLLTEKFGVQAQDVLTYGVCFDRNPPNIEAEDLFPNALLERVIEEHGDDVYDSKARVREIPNHWHIGFTQRGKGLLPDWIWANADQSIDYERFTKLFDAIDSALAREELRRSRATLASNQ